jgi:hypothetical protein
MGSLFIIRGTSNGDNLTFISLFCEDVKTIIAQSHYFAHKLSQTLCLPSGKCKPLSVSVLSESGIAIWLKQQVKLLMLKFHCIMTMVYLTARL